jgi:hypothetical protein
MLAASLILWLGQRELANGVVFEDIYIEYTMTNYSTLCYIGHLTNHIIW